MPVVIIDRCSDRSASLCIHLESKTRRLLLVDIYCPFKGPYCKLLARFRSCLSMYHSAFCKVIYVHLGKYACGDIHCLLCHHKPEPTLHGKICDFKAVPFSVVHIVPDMLSRLLPCQEIDADPSVGFPSFLDDPCKQRAVRCCIDQGLSGKDIPWSHDEPRPPYPLIKGSIIELIPYPDQEDVVISDHRSLMIECLPDR